ncbi:MAG: hypothetical protein U1E27_01635, partial [Kiritimatiellia bacterium]|nr:hypothetical protein [Kiritimatiellia bacterium]
MKSRYFFLPLVLLSGLLFSFFPATARALGPHEVAVLVNGRSRDSMEIANVFIHLRGIPLENVVYLDLPDSVRTPAAEISPEDFSRWIWDPASEILNARGVSGHILAWVYSADFPIRVRTQPTGTSLHGMTFMRGTPIIHSVTNEQGLAVHTFPNSPFFRGPSQPQAPQGPALSLDRFRDAMPGRLPPLP